MKEILIRLSLRISIRLLKIGGVNMVDVYIALIIRKFRTIETVPVQLKVQVSEGLTLLDLDGNGDPIVTE